MDKQIKRLLLTQLSSKRKMAKFLKRNLPITASRSYANCFYIFIFDENNIFHFDGYHNKFHFEKWVRSDDAFYCREIERYDIDDLKQELNLSESWFKSFVNED